MQPRSNTETSQIDLETKLDHLSRAASYPDATNQVERVETHFAWVFLTDSHAYKLKKPIRYHGIDFTTLERRRHNCDEELRLNRRLAADVYIDVVPLALRSTGLALEAEGPVADWLVKMHRLPRERMLDRAAEGTIDPALLDAFVARLAAFYRQAEPAPWSASEYRRHLQMQIDDWQREIAVTGAETEVAALASAQQNFLLTHGDRLDERIAAHRVVDAHGDLRPEHICLGPEPVVIDCLEFSTELRLLDSAEELAFLDLECEALGRADLGRDIVGRYLRRADAGLPPALYRFYRSRRALGRALVCAWRLAEPLPAAPNSGEPVSAETLDRPGSNEPCRNEPGADGQRRSWRARRDWYLAAGRRCLGR